MDYKYNIPSEQMKIQTIIQLYPWIRMEFGGLKKKKIKWTQDYVQYGRLLSRDNSYIVIRAFSFISELEELHRRDRHQTKNRPSMASHLTAKTGRSVVGFESVSVVLPAGCYYKV